MKKMKVFSLALLFSILLSTFASADVAGIGTVIVFGLLPYVLIAAVVVIAVVVLVKVLKHRRQDESDGVKK